MTAKKSARKYTNVPNNPFLPIPSLGKSVIDVATAIRPLLKTYLSEGHKGFHLDVAAGWAGLDAQRYDAVAIGPALRLLGCAPRGAGAHRSWRVREVVQPIPLAPPAEVLAADARGWVVTDEGAVRVSRDQHTCDRNGVLRPSTLAILTNAALPPSSEEVSWARQWLVRHTFRAPGRQRRDAPVGPEALAAAASAWLPRIGVVEPHRYIELPPGAIVEAAYLLDYQVELIGDGPNVRLPNLRVRMLFVDDYRKIPTWESGRRDDVRAWSPKMVALLQRLPSWVAFAAPESLRYFGIADNDSRPIDDPSPTPPPEALYDPKMHRKPWQRLRKSDRRVAAVAAAQAAATAAAKAFAKQAAREGLEQHRVLLETFADLRAVAADEPITVARLDELHSLRARRVLERAPVQPTFSILGNPDPENT
jgi:hypothetical protein